jgi:hypothetical protein
VDLSIYHGATIALTDAQLRTRVDLRNSTMRPQGASSVVFENLIQGYNKVTYGMASIVSSEDLIRWAP